VVLLPFAICKNVGCATVCSGGNASGPNLSTADSVDIRTLNHQSPGSQYHGTAHAEISYQSIFATIPSPHFPRASAALPLHGIALPHPAEMRDESAKSKGKPPNWTTFVDPGAADNPFELREHPGCGLRSPGQNSESVEVEEDTS